MLYTVPASSIKVLNCLLSSGDIKHISHSLSDIILSSIELYLSDLFHSWSLRNSIKSLQYWEGIPVLSFIFNFNDDYEGADLCFWDDYIIPLAKGDIVMFPSTFLFPHRVTKCIKGTRYSGAVWGW